MSILLSRSRLFRFLREDVPVEVPVIADLRRLSGEFQAVFHFMVSRARAAPPNIPASEICSA